MCCVQYMMKAIEIVGWHVMPWLGPACIIAWCLEQGHFFFRASEKCTNYMYEYDGCLHFPFPPPKVACCRV